MSETFTPQLLGELDSMIDKLVEHCRKPEVTDEFEQIRQHLETKQELERLYKERQNDIKEVIKSWRDNLQALKIEASTSHAEEYDASYELLVQEEREIKNRIAQYEQDIDQLKANINKYKADAIEIERQQQEMERLHAADVPRLQNLLKLYRSISGLRWDYQSTKVKGSINGRSMVLNFEFDQDEMSRYQICQNLWEMIEKAA